MKKEFKENDRGTIMNQLEKAMQQAKTSTEIEGFKIKPEHTALVKARLNDEITEEEFQEKVKEQIK